MAGYSQITSSTDSGLVAGGIIQHTLFREEFTAIVNAFNATTGHTHDGTAGEGGIITTLRSNPLTFGAVDTNDVVITFEGGSGNDGVLTWDQSADKFIFGDTVRVSGNLEVTGTADFGESNFTNVGSIALDSITGDDDPNTSITFSGSDVITMKTNDTTRFVVNNTGVAVTGTSTLTGATTVDGDLTVYHEDSDSNANANPTLTLQRKTSGANPQVNDNLGQIIFKGEDGGGADTDYIKLLTSIADATAGSEDAKFMIQGIKGGANKNIALFRSELISFGQRNTNENQPVEINGPMYSRVGGLSGSRFVHSEQGLNLEGAYTVPIKNSRTIDTITNTSAGTACLVTTDLDHGFSDNMLLYVDNTNISLLDGKSFFIMTVDGQPKQLTLHNAYDGADPQHSGATASSGNIGGLGYGLRIHNTQTDSNHEQDCSIELGGNDDVFIDLKKTNAQDYDLRVAHLNDNISYVSSKTGHLVLKTETNGSSVLLQHEGANTKLQTTDTGVDVTGEVKGDSLDIDGNAAITGTVTIDPPLVTSVAEGLGAKGIIMKQGDLRMKVDGDYDADGTVNTKGGSLQNNSRIIFDSEQHEHEQGEGLGLRNPAFVIQANYNHNADSSFGSAGTEYLNANISQLGNGDLNISSGKLQLRGKVETPDDGQGSGDYNDVVAGDDYVDHASYMGITLDGSTTQGTVTRMHYGFINDNAKNIRLEPSVSGIIVGGDGDATGSGTTARTDPATIGVNADIDLLTLANQKLTIKGDTTAGGIGDTDHALVVEGAVTIKGTSDGGQLIVENSGTSGSDNPDIVLFNNNTGNGADGDKLGGLHFYGKDSAGNHTNYGNIVAEIVESQDGSTEAGKIVIRPRTANSAATDIATIDGSGLTVAGAGTFNVGANALNVNSTGVGTALNIKTNSTTNANGPDLQFQRAVIPNVSGDNFHRIGEVTYKSKNTNDDDFDYVKLRAKASDHRDGQELGSFDIFCAAGTGAAFGVAGAYSEHNFTKDGLDVTGAVTAGTATFSSGELANNLVVATTTSSISAAPDVVFVKDRSTAPAAGEKLGNIIFQAPDGDNNATNVTYGKIQVSATAVDASADTYSGQIDFFPQSEATSTANNETVSMKVGSTDFATNINVTGKITASASGIADNDVAVYGSGVADDDFLRINGTDVEGLSASEVKTALSLAKADVGLGNVDNESKATMFSSPTFTGTVTAPALTASLTVAVESATKDATAMTALIGKRIIHTGAAVTYTMPDVGAGDAGKTWTIMNNGTGSLTINRTTNSEFFELVAGQTSSATTSITLLKGGVAEFIVQEANKIVVVGSGI
jgi:hypothetical protein